MRPNYTTIVTPIVAGREGVLKQYLRDHAEPRPGSPCEDFLRCRSLFPFDKIKCLHFCSFSVLDEDGEFGPSLILEATFDGSRADFLRELWRVAPAGMHAVYGHCVGYPATGLAVPELIEEYLVRHDVGADTFFSGCPGRCVAQIQGESRVRSEIVAFLSSRQAANAPPPTLAALQQAMQRDVVRMRPENRWAEQPAVTPWEIANRTWVVRAVIVAATAGMCALGALAVRILFGKGTVRAAELDRRAVQPDVADRRANRSRGIPRVGVARRPDARAATADPLRSPGVGGGLDCRARLGAHLPALGR